MNDAEVVIVGAGPGGAATALALLGAGVPEVVLVDKPVRTPFRIGESATPDVPGLLRRLGLDGNLSAQGHRPHHANLSLWGGAREIGDFLHRGQGHGWQLARAEFDAELRRAAIERGARYLTPAHVIGLVREGDDWRVGFNHAGKPFSLRTRLLVDAAGRRAPVATRLGARRYRIDHLVALAVIVPDAADLEGLVLVEAIAEGWWYATRLPDGRGLLALMSDADLVREQGWRHPERYRALWAKTSELRRRLVLPATYDISVFPAQSGFIDRAAGPGWLAVGDALVSFDPLTSSGISGALSDALAVAEPIRAWLGKSPERVTASLAYGQRADATLRRYLAQRLQHYRREPRWPDQPFWARRQRAIPESHFAGG